MFNPKEDGGGGKGERRDEEREGVVVGRGGWEVGKVLISAL